MNADQCRTLALARVDAEEAIDRIEELLKIAERTGDKIRQQVYGDKLAEKRERLKILTETYRVAGCRGILDDETEQAERAERERVARPKH
jgi:hypothetical protein